MIVLINRGCSIAAIICFILLAASLIIAQNSIATGYELDLYGNTPLLTWVFLTLSVICGISILILQIATKGYKVGYLWIVGLLLLVTTRVSLLCIPYIRGYGPWRGDNLYHLGLVRDILSNGYLTEGNFYPIMHILISEITFTAGIPYYIVAALSTPFVSALFVLTTYMLATAILPRKGQQILATGLAAVVMIFSGYDLYLMPVGWTLFLLPLLLFFYFKQSTTPYRILFLILLVSFPFFHPFTAVMVILSLIILELSRVSLVHISRHNKEITQTSTKRILLNSALLEAVILLPWLLSFNRFQPNIRIMWEQILSGTAPSVVDAMAATLNKINIRGLDFISLLIKLNGAQIIMIALSLTTVFILLKQLRSNGANRETQRLFCLASLFLCVSIAYFLFIVGLPGMQPIAGARILPYSMVMTPVLAGFALYKMLDRVNWNFIACGAALCVIMLASILGILQLFPSPWTIRPSLQTTQMDMAGMKWIIEQKDRQSALTNIMSPTDRFAYSLIGFKETTERADLKGITIPDHFGYYTHSRLGESYTHSSYAIITGFDRIIYSTVWVIVGRFDQFDFEKLNLDPSADKLYCSRETEIWYISVKK